MGKPVQSSPVPSHSLACFCRPMHYSSVTNILYFILCTVAIGLMGLV